MCIQLVRRVLVIGYVALFLGAASIVSAETPGALRSGEWPGLPRELKRIPTTYTMASQDTLYTLRQSLHTRSVLRYATMLHLGRASMILQVKARPKPRSVVKFELLF